MESAGSQATRKRKHCEMVAHHAMNVFNATMLLSMVIIHELEMNESAVACVFFSGMKVETATLFRAMVLAEQSLKPAIALRQIVSMSEIDT